MTVPEQETETRATTNVERREPANVHEAIRCVMLDLGGIPKMTGQQHKARLQAQGTGDGDEKGVPYAYRSVDQITGDGQRLFAEYGCIWTPKVLEQTEREFVMGKYETRWVDVTFKVIYWVVGPGGAKVVIPTTKHFDTDGGYVESPDPEAWYLEGDVHLVGPLYSVGRDNSDKGQNKALTQALKQALLQTLSIGDPQDGDHEKHEQTGSGPRVVTDEMATEFKGKVGRLPKEHAKALVDELKAENLPVPEMMDTAQYGKANAMLQLHVIQAHRGEPPAGASAVDSAVVNPTDPGATDEEMSEARDFLAEMVEAVPEVDGEGKSQRMLLRSHLTGLFGADEDRWTYEQVLEATTRASCWPDPPAGLDEGSSAPEAPQDPIGGPTEQAVASREPGAPRTPIEVLREIVGPEPTDTLLDEVLAEVQTMKGPERKEGLRERDLPLGGSVTDLGYRLATALVRERHEG